MYRACKVVDVCGNELFYGNESECMRYVRLNQGDDEPLGIADDDNPEHDASNFDPDDRDDEDFRVYDRDIND